MTGIEPSSGAQDAGDDEEEEDEDEDDTPYCFCRQPSLGDMIACDNKGCRYEWFHVKCLKMKRAPSGTWYCQDCSKLRRRERDRQRRRRR
ncbi:hypothetical protein BC828DRAFT_349244 [Blastocladiella britannica]|nr:hypothetical protein BC828DRAFT_349244 [Blastocladiella britannica]